jgi:hypothetical protein
MRSYWEILAEHMEEHPEAVQQALDTLEAWLGRGQGSPRRLLEWQGPLLKARQENGMKALIEF